LKPPFFYESDVSIMSYAEVILNIPVVKSYCYHIPEEFKSSIAAGMRVLVPLGNREVTGVVVALSQRPSFSDCKAIIDVLDTNPLVSRELLDLTCWISSYYHASWGQVVQLALPRGTERFSVQKLYPVEENLSDGEQLTERQTYLFNMICREPGKAVKNYEQEFGSGAFHYILHKLIDKGFVKRQQALQKERVGTRMVKYVSVKADFQEYASAFRGGLDMLAPFVGKFVLLSEFRDRTGYAASKVKRLVKKGIISVQEQESQRIPLYSYKEKQQDIVLTERQQKVLEEITGSVRREKFGVYLVHGVTGSGKTQIYLEAIHFALSRRKTAIVLIPEISLTPQTVARFATFFPGKIAVFHSKMSLGERYDAWHKVFEGAYPIVIGPRSALFMPLKNIGIIVVDEEHDSSYKQSSATPRYHARDVAVYRGMLNQATVVLGSATPSLESYYNTERKKYRLLEMPERISGIRLPKVHVVDMRHEKKTSRVFSQLLMAKIGQRLKRREQVILLQNRRGYAAFFQCMACGFIARCPHCEISLTYHAYNRKLQCHYCSYMRDVPDHCPNCHSDRIIYKGVGTQKIAEELRRIFPQSRFMRMDLDTTSGKNAHDRILHSFQEESCDILLGTQMIAKGLDFEKVTLVGVISADIGLSLPDFRAGEKVFQLLTQVAGRAGRREKVGEVVIQTYQFTHYAIQYAKAHDYMGFYREEMRYRKSMQYPPFVRLVNLNISGNDLSKTITAAREIGQILRRSAKKYYTVIGPAPAPISKLKNRYRWQIFVKLDNLQDSQGHYFKKTVSDRLAPYLFSKAKEQQVSVDIDPIDMT
jgi:primosomal protein N' (replication factor Y)